MALEADAENLLGSYASTRPERIRSLGAEERHRIYELLELRALAQRDGSVKLSGAVGDIGGCVNEI